MTNKPISVISGANGFIGSNLAKHLMNKGHLVAQIPTELLASPVYLEKFLKAHNPDYIFHLAAYGNHYDQKDIDHTIYANIIKTYTLLRSSLEIPYKGFFNFSTSSVYGKKISAMSERDLPEPNTPYACTKMASEHLANAFFYDCDKPIVNIRPFSVYGPGEADNRLIPTIIRSLVNKEHMTLYPDPVHDWIYIDDFVAGVYRVMELVDRFKGDVVNIGTGRQMKNQEIFDLLSELNGSSTVAEKEDSNRSYDTGVWKADVSKLAIFDWRAPTSVEAGLYKCLNHYKKKYTHPKERVYSLTDIMEDSVEKFGGKFESI